MPAAKTQSDDNDTILYNMFGSMTSGLFARIPAHPLDTCKAKLQVQQSALKNASNQALTDLNYLQSDPHFQSKYIQKYRQYLPKFVVGDTTIGHRQNFKSTFDVLSYTIKREGLLGLYRGMAISIIGGCPASCLYFTSYELTRRQLNKYEFNDLTSDFIGGFMAEVFSCILWVPIDVIKERMQVQSVINPEYRYKSMSDAFVKMLRNEGFNGLYRAYGATILSFGPFSALYLMIYEQLKSMSGGYIAPSACTAGAIAAVITNPLDMIKLRLQVQRGGIYNFGYNNIFDGLYKIVRYESVGSLWHGSMARVLYWVPNLAVNLSLYEYITQFYKSRELFD